jgi:hypothetical protein
MVRLKRKEMLPFIGITCFLSNLDRRVYKLCGDFIFHILKVRFILPNVEGIFGHSNIEHCNLPVFQHTLLQPHFSTYFFS